MAEDAGLRTRRRRFLRRRKRRRRDIAMTVVDHLGELRTRLIISAVAFLALSVVAFILYAPILEFFKRPLCQVDPERFIGTDGCELVATGALGGFQFRLKLTALVGIAAASPIWLYQLWAFIVPALTIKERRYAVPFLASAITLFLVGATFAYLVLPTGLQFLLDIGGEGITFLFRADEYLTFVGLLLIAFGITFELPLVLIFLGLAGAVSVEQLRTQRKTAVVSIVVLAAVATPTQDPFTMLIMSALLYAMYEGTILILAALLRRRRTKHSV